MATDIFRCIGFVKMYYIQGRTKPEDKFVLRNESTHALSCLTPTEIFKQSLKVVNLWFSSDGKHFRCKDCAIDKLPQYDLNGCSVSTTPQVIISGYSKSSGSFTLITSGGNEVDIPEKELVSAMTSGKILVSNATVTSKGILRLTCKDTIDYHDDRDENATVYNKSLISKLTSTASNTVLSTSFDRFSLESIYARYISTSVLAKEVSVADMLKKAHLKHDVHLQMVDALTDAIRSRLEFTAVALSSRGYPVSLYGLLAKPDAENAAGGSNGVDFAANFVISNGKSNKMFVLNLTVGTSFHIYVTSISERGNVNVLQNLLPLYLQSADVNAGEYYLEGRTSQPEWFLLLRKAFFSLGKSCNSGGAFPTMRLEFFETAIRNFNAFTLKHHPANLSKFESAASNFAKLFETALVRSIKGSSLNTSIYHVAHSNTVDSFAIFSTYSDSTESELSLAAVLIAINQKNGAVMVLDTLGFNQCDEFSFDMMDCTLSSFERVNDVHSIIKSSHSILLRMRKILTFKSLSQWEDLLKSFANNL